MLRGQFITSLVCLFALFMTLSVSMDVIKSPPKKKVSRKFSESSGRFQYDDDVDDDGDDSEWYPVYPKPSPKTQMSRNVKKMESKQQPQKKSEAVSLTVQRDKTNLDEWDFTKIDYDMYNRYLERNMKTPDDRNDYNTFKTVNAMAQRGKYVCKGCPECQERRILKAWLPFY